jgi:hypothetical protein
MLVFSIRIETIHAGFDTGGKDHRPLNQPMLAVSRPLTLVSIRVFYTRLNQQ